MQRKTMTSRRAAVGLSVLAVLGGAATVATQPAIANPSHASGAQCSLIQEPLVVEGAAPSARTEQFADYGDTSGAWIGADSTYSAVLKDGSIAWLFSDTVLGDVVDGQSVDMDTMGFVNNSIVIERDGELVETVTGGTPDARDSLFPPPAEDSWFWLGAGYAAPNGELHIGLNRYDRFGPGLWDWEWSHTAVGTMDTRTWQVTDVAEMDVDSPVQWTSWYERTQGKTYIYGVHDQGVLKQAHVARVPGHDISRFSKWEYWTGNGWSKDPSSSVPIQDNVANEYSVTKFRDGYLLVTQDTSELFSTRIVAYTACDPTGPFTGPTELFHTPETGPDGSYGDPNVWTYNAHVHPEFSDDDSLLISYNVNTFDNEHIFDDVTIYRPRFWTVDL